ncbi:MAG: hypothetical protein RR066_07410 [Mucinivorans sp.]
MENRLQQLTEKLYQEGLSKGQAEAEQILAQAKKEADAIVAQAQAKAQSTEASAQKAAAELMNNTKKEVQMASEQIFSELRSRIERMVTMETLSPVVSAAWSDGAFVKELILKAVSGFNPTDAEPVKVVVPEAFVEQIKAVVADKFGKGVTVVTDSKVKVPFRIAPATGGYYVSFTDADFDALLKSYLRSNVVELLYGK